METEIHRGIVIPNIRHVLQEGRCRSEPGLRAAAAPAAPCNHEPIPTETSEQVERAAGPQLGCTTLCTPNLMGERKLREPQNLGA